MRSFLFGGYEFFLCMKAVIMPRARPPELRPEKKKWHKNGDIGYEFRCDEQLKIRFKTQCFNTTTPPAKSFLDSPLLDLQRICSVSLCTLTYATCRYKTGASHVHVGVALQEHAWTRRPGVNTILHLVRLSSKCSRVCVRASVLHGGFLITVLFYLQRAAL